MCSFQYFIVFVLETFYCCQWNPYLSPLIQIILKFLCGTRLLAMNVFFKKVCVYVCMHECTRACVYCATAHTCLSEDTWEWEWILMFPLILRHTILFLLWYCIPVLSSSLAHLPFLRRSAQLTHAYPCLFPLHGSRNSYSAHQVCTALSLWVFKTHLNSSH